MHGDPDRGTCAMLGVRYGSPEAVKMTDYIMNNLKGAVYDTSIALAEERGTFPLYDADRFGKSSPVVKGLQDETRGLLKEHGIRNGVLLTVAPTGTTSLYAGNVSSGLEPVFLHKATRNVRQPDDTFKPYTVYDYGYLLYCNSVGIDPDRSGVLPPYMVTHADLTAADHIGMQSTCQRHIDSSVSKTINCPQDMTFSEFEDIYTSAYMTDCKGCTTYRFSEVRGSILESADTKEIPPAILTRPDVLSGHTYKVKWPNISENYYVTINDMAGRPFEVFFQSTSSKYTDWTTALGLMISAIMRKGGDISFISEELAKVRSADDVGYVDGKFYGSLVALFGATIGKHMNSGVDSAINTMSFEVVADTQTPSLAESSSPGETCPQCNQPKLIPQEGCLTCTNCSYSKCD